MPDINPDFKHVTIARVLSHTSGLPDYLGNPAVNQIWHKYLQLTKLQKVLVSNRLVLIQEKHMSTLILGISF